MNQIPALSKCGWERFVKSSSSFAQMPSHIFTNMGMQRTPQRLWKHSICIDWYFPAMGEDQTDLTTCTLSTCARKVPWEPFFFAFVLHFIAMTVLYDLHLWQKCFFSSATPEWETERLNGKENFKWKLRKPLCFCAKCLLLFQRHFKTTCPLYLCVASFNPSQLPFVDNSNWRPFTLPVDHWKHCISIHFVPVASCSPSLVIFRSNSKSVSLSLSQIQLKYA